MTPGRPAAATGYRISEVSRRTGIPITTLRFYERELPGLFPLRKTRGGHRRYAERDVERFVTVRRLSREGVRLGEVRRVMMSRGDADALREEVDGLRDGAQVGAQTLEDVLRRVEDLESRLSRLEAVPRRRPWLSRFPRE